MTTSKTSKAKWVAGLAAVVMVGAAQADALQGRDINGNAVLGSDISAVFLYDPDLNITWLKDANAGAGSVYDDGSSPTDGRMAWQRAKGWADALVVGIFDDWRLPTTLQPDASCGSQIDAGAPFGLQGYGDNCTGSEMGHLWYTELGNTAGSLTNTGDFGTTLQSSSFGNYWSGTVYAPNASGAWYFGTTDGNQSANFLVQSSELYAMAVRSGDVAAVVPEVQTYAMLLAGLGALAVVVRRRPV